MEFLEMKIILSILIILSLTACKNSRSEFHKERLNCEKRTGQDCSFYALPNDASDQLQAIFDTYKLEEYK